MLATANKHSDYLGRYYTAPPIATALVHHMRVARPRTVLDLGSGNGALTSAVVKAWPSADVITVDADREIECELQRAVRGCSRKAKHSHYSFDALSDHLTPLLNHPVTAVDAAVCNPPFTTPEWQRGFGAILEEAGFSGCVPILRDVDASLLFLSQNIRFVKTGATIGIILPDTLVSSTRYTAFRGQLLRRYQVRHVLQLPRYSFGGTDALAHIVIIGKQMPNAGTLQLSSLGRAGELLGSVFVNMENARYRMDYDYHAINAVPRNQVSSLLRLSDVVTEIRRGSISSVRFDEFSGHLLHTTDISATYAGRWVNLKSMGLAFDSAANAGSRFVVASPGDIILARVGRNLERKVMGIRSGNAILSDCLYRLRVAEEMRGRLLAYFHSDEGRMWLSSRSYGVGAKHLTKSELLNMPIGGSILNG